MMKIKKFTALLLALILCVSFSACSKSGDDMKEWLDRISTAYEGYIASADGKNAVSPSVSLLITSEEYLKAVFDYMESGAQPEGSEITEENGVYTYRHGTFKQIIEIDTKTPAVKVEMVQEQMGESYTEFITVLSEKNDEYFIQHLWTQFGEYYEIRFTEQGGSTTTVTDCYKLPYSIFAAEIPENFAKEN